MPVSLPELAAELSQLEIEPIDVVSTSAPKELSLEQLMASGIETQANTIVAYNSCLSCSCCCCVR